MALVQKRPFSETTKTLQIENVEPPKKKIKIQLKGTERSFAGLLKRLESSSSSNETLQILSEISDCPSFYDLTLEAVRFLINMFRKEKDFIRVKILYLLSDFVLDHGIDACTILEDILILMKSEESSKVICQSFTSMLNIVQAGHVIPSALYTRIIDYSKHKLSSTNYNVQRHAISLIGSIASKEDGEKDLLHLVSHYMDSPDARTRAQALNSILCLGSRSMELPQSLYARVEKHLKDDYECVRREALQLIFEISQRHPEITVKIKENDMEINIRLIDDAFGKVCSAISDLSLQVRVQAAELLGQMLQVNNEFLFQTLDKKLMSNMRRKKTSHERAFENYTSGEWSSGKKWADDAPQELINTESISLIDSGACGALVQGLEDEFLEVRMASVKSMCKLSLNNPPFAELSLDFLVDMFNDEIEDVRLQAIYSLTKISEHIILREDQLEIMLGSLEDYSVEVREGLHLMLGACRVSTRACLTLVVQKVLDVLSKYPQDKLSAYGCMNKVGSKHPELCMALTPLLIQDHPFLDTAEKDVEDPAYVCVLIMLFNAAKNMPPMLSLFPDIILKHYAYLRDTMPNFVPYLPVRNQTEMTLVGTTGSQQFLRTLLSNIEATYYVKTARQSLLQAAQNNLSRLASIDPELSGTANFTRDYLGAELLMEQLQINLMNHRVPSRESLNQLINKCLRLQNLFSNLTLEDHLLVKQICVRASALNLVLVVKDKSQSALLPCQLLLHVASDVQQFLQQNSNLSTDSFTKSILSYLDTVSDPKPGRVSRGILPIVQSSNYLPNSLSLNFNIKMCTARIIYPDEAMANDNENIIKVTAGLIAALPIHAEIEQLQECQRENLRIKIKYPDQNIHVVMPRLRDLRRIIGENGNEMPNSWRLRTNVLLSHGIWTEPSQVDISICLSVKPSNELELCKPVKVIFSPKPIRKGI